MIDIYKNQQFPPTNKIYNPQKQKPPTNNCQENFFKNAKLFSLKKNWKIKKTCSEQRERGERVIAYQIVILLYEFQGGKMSHQRSTVHEKQWRGEPIPFVCVCVCVCVSVYMCGCAWERERESWCCVREMNFFFVVVVTSAKIEIQEDLSLIFFEHQFWRFR